MLLLKFVHVQIFHQNIMAQKFMDFIKLIDTDVTMFHIRDGY